MAAGITAGFLALLGIDTAGAIDDGVAIGANFVSGFMDGLDFDGILDGLKTWAESHKAQVAAIGAVLGFKLVTAQQAPILNSAVLPRRLALEAAQAPARALLVCLPWAALSRLPQPL